MRCFIMRISKIFRTRHEYPKVIYSLPVVNALTGNHTHCRVVAYKLPCGRTIWVIPCASAFVLGSFSSILDDAVFQSANDLFHALSLGGRIFKLDISRNHFYSALNVCYRSGYNRPSFK